MTDHKGTTTHDRSQEAPTASCLPDMARALCLRWPRIDWPVCLTCFVCAGRPCSIWCTENMAGLMHAYAQHSSQAHTSWMHCTLRCTMHTFYQCDARKHWQVVYMYVVLHLVLRRRCYTGTRCRILCTCAWGVRVWTGLEDRSTDSMR
jgi:hypothetical protein